MTTIHAPAHSDPAEGHGHTARPAYDDINVPVVILIGIISTVVTLLTIWFVEGVYHRWKNSVVRDVTYEVANLSQSELVVQQQKILEGDPDRGIASLESVIPGIVERYNSGGGDAGESKNPDAGEGDRP